MQQLLLQYAIVVGMPEAVQTFLNTRQMNDVLQIQRDIVRSYEDDMVKYAGRKDFYRVVFMDIKALSLNFPVYK